MRAPRQVYKKKALSIFSLSQLSSLRHLQIHRLSNATPTIVIGFITKPSDVIVLLKYSTDPIFKRAFEQYDTPLFPWIWKFVAQYSAVLLKQKNSQDY